jgi:hypothetical protein
MAHLDETIGALARVAQWLRPRPRNTIGDLVAYEGVPRERLFPVPDEPVQVRRSRRWQLPGLVSEDVRFVSQHSSTSTATCSPRRRSRSSAC